ncbi:MAG: ABC transporter permease [Candidatus Woesebacteria bacterium]|jgi:ABC-2 type transport system permease protein
MKIHRLHAFFLRHIYPLKRNFDLLSDMIYWPLIDTVLWGVTGQWLVESSGVTTLVASILVALILWNVIWRSQSEVSRNLIDEIWNHNLVNLFSTPLTVKEWVIGVLLLSLLKTMITLVILVPAIYFLYTVNVFQLGWWLIIFFLSTAMTGWWLGFIAAGIILRFGPKLQTVVWTMPAILLPFSAVYFPLTRLPTFIRPISQLIPTTYIFESMRSLLQHQTIELSYLFFSFVLNFIYLFLSIAYFRLSFNKSKNLGLGRFD